MTLTELPNDIDTLKQLVLDRHRQMIEREEQVVQYKSQVVQYESRVVQCEEQLAERDKEIARQTQQLAERDEWLAEQEAKIKGLHSQLAYMKRQMFGRRGEKIDPNQLLLFSELKAQADALEEEIELEEIRYKRRKKGHGRKPLPGDWPVEEVEYPLEKTDCPCCGEPMQTIGKEVTNEADYHPGSFFIRRHIRPKYACRQCQEGVHIAPMPPRPIHKGIAGPGLLAHVLTSKYSDHIPLNRLRGMLRRHRLDVSVASLCDWVARMADLLTPIHDALKAQLLAGHLIQSDDTQVPYQLPELKKQIATGYLWTYLCESSRLVLYEFTESRGRAGPSGFLSGFKGNLLTDGYSGYNESVERYGLTRGGCWSHARRKYYDARLDDRVRCSRMLKLIQALFAIERRAKEMRANPNSGFGDVEHLALRQSESSSLIEEIRARTDAWSDEVLPRSSVGQAVSYMRNQWQPLTVFLKDATIPLDNNAAERAMRHVVIGRKNWTFAGSVEGGHRAAKIFSIVVTCRLNGLDPFVYLRDVIDRLPRGHDSALLLPTAWKADQLTRPAPTA